LRLNGRCSRRVAAVATQAVAAPKITIYLPFPANRTTEVALGFLSKKSKPSKVPDPSAQRLLLGTFRQIGLEIGFSLSVFDAGSRTEHLPVRVHVYRHGRKAFEWETVLDLASGSVQVWQNEWEAANEAVPHEEDLI